MAERIKIYNPDKLTKNVVDELINQGFRFDIVAGLEESDYSEIEVSEVHVDDHRTTALY